MKEVWDECSGLSIDGIGCTRKLHRFSPLPRRRRGQEPLWLQQRGGSEPGEQGLFRPSLLQRLWPADERRGREADPLARERGDTRRVLLERRPAQQLDAACGIRLPSAGGPRRV